jgi:hypothetical protein
LNIQYSDLSYGFRKLISRALYKEFEENRPELSELSILLPSQTVTATPILLHFPSSRESMVRGQPLPDDLRKVILNMARYLDVPSIRHYTGCPTRNIERLISEGWRKTRKEA